MTARPSGIGGHGLDQVTQTFQVKDSIGGPQRAHLAAAGIEVRQPRLGGGV